MSRLTIYFTSDTHGYLYPSNFASRESRAMGLLSMRFPKDGNTLVIDGGDTIQGSPLLYYCRLHGHPLPVADALNARGYDYVTLGNHDFNNGQAELRAYLDALNAQCLCANVDGTEWGLPIASTAVRVMENGLRVGLVGLVTDWVKRWEKPEHLQGIHITDPLSAARGAVSALRDQVDVLIGIYHGGIERDLSSGRLLSGTDENIACRLCEELPFDLLLTGHQHMAVAGQCWNGVHLVQTPSNATSYAKVTLEEDGFHSELCAPTAQACLTPTETALWHDVSTWLDQPIGRLSRAIWPEDKLTMALHGSSIADFFNLVQLWATGADISCAALGNDIRGFDSHVTVRDVVASYVYSNTLVVLEVTGAVLKEALEQCARYFAVDEHGEISIAESFLRPKEAHYNYDYFYGISYAFDLSRPAGNRVTSLSRKGMPLRTDDRLTLCMCDYRATGSGNFDCYLTCPRVGENLTQISELILSYLLAHPMVELPEAHGFQVTMAGKQL